MTLKSHQDEMRFFNGVSNWWDVAGDMAPLHKMNEARLQFITATLKKNFSITAKNEPLSSLRILDVGCGGGLVCEPLKRLGADVSGIDANETSIAAAKEHAQAMGLDIKYQLGKVEDLPEDQLFDAVIALEVIEHVDNPGIFVANCLKNLKPDGVLILSTMNRTKLSYIGGIFLAERVLKWLPKGAHDWYKFLKPSEIREFLNENKAEVMDLSGITYTPLTGSWRLSKQLTINYILSAKKNINL